MRDSNQYKRDGIFATPEFFVQSGEASIRGIIRELYYYSQYSYSLIGEGNIVFFESVEYVNNYNYHNMYMKVLGLYKNQTYVFPQKKRDIRIWDYAREFISLLIELREEHKKTSLYVKLSYLKARIELVKLKKVLLLSEKKVLVTFCDVHPVDALVVQFAKKNHIKTVTLQHGHFNAKDRPWVFNKSYSDYFLLHGRYAMEEALESGHNLEGLMPVGMMNYVGQQRKKIVFNTDNKVFALFLNGPGAKEDNEDMIRMANKICAKYGLKYIVRSHPAIHLSTYKEILDMSFMKRESAKDEAISTLFECTQFTIVGNSTVFIESLFMGKMTFRFINKAQDIYDRVQWCAFRSDDEFVGIYDEAVSNWNDMEKKIVDTVSYLCEPGDIGDNYRNALDKIVGEECL